MQLWTQLIDEVLADDSVREKGDVEDETQPWIASERVGENVANVNEVDDDHIPYNDALRSLNHDDLR